MIPIRSQRLIYFFLLSLCVLLSLASINHGLNTWDEETDYLGIRSTIAHAVDLLRGNNPDFRDIHSNLEFYGSVGMLPAWIAWFFQQSLLVDRISLSQALFDPTVDHQLTGFFETLHLTLLIYLVLISALAIKISNKLKINHYYMAGALALLVPSLLGHSFTNSKDIPFAFFYTLYTYTLIQRRTKTPVKYKILSIISAGLLVNIKFVAFLPVAISEILFNLTLARSHSASRTKFISIPLFLLCVISIALLLQPASWLQYPHDYISEAFATFSRHKWGGCMWWKGTCIGIYSEEWSAFKYILKWLLTKLPILLIFLLFVYAYSIISSFKSLSSTVNNHLFVITQLLLIPFLASFGNSNLYDTDRHLLFIYPPIAILSSYSLDKIFATTPIIFASKPIKALTCAFFLILVVDNLTLFPYNTSYLNEATRFFLDYTNTSIEYWGSSSKEALRLAQRSKKLPLNPVVRDSLSPLPLFINARQLAFHVSSDSTTEIIFQLRNPDSFNDLSTECELGSTVTRTLFPFKTLTLSKLWICPK